MLRMIATLWCGVSFVLTHIGKLHQLEEKKRSMPAEAETEALALIQGVFRHMLKRAGAEIEVRGLEQIPKDQPVLYVGNHRSYFDIITCYSLVPGRTGFVSKDDLARVPLLSDWMRLLGCVFLNRGDIKEALKTILEAIHYVKSGTSIWIFPEGTRNTADNPADLMPFKEGSLKIAAKADCPVVPVAITGTRELFEQQFPRVKPGKVTVTFGEPFRIRELSEEDKRFPGAYTRQRIIAMLEGEQDR